MFDVKRFFLLLWLCVADAPSSLSGDLSGQVRGYLDASLDLFMADRTGKADFALRSAGGSVVSTRCTKTHTAGNLGFSIFGYHINFPSDTSQLVSVLYLLHVS